MELLKNERLSLFERLKKNLKKYSDKEIENGVMNYTLASYGLDDFTDESDHIKEIVNLLSSYQFPTDLEVICEFFESLLEKENKEENGIVFTPKFIAEYMVKEAFRDHSLEKSLVIDPSCGCGIFLISAAEFILKSTSKSIDSIIEENIYGIDIVSENVRRCELVLKLLSAKHNGDYKKVKPNLRVADSLKVKWNELFRVQSFHYIFGNPPYVNPHDMGKETSLFLKANYITTKKGTFNIFYAFIERGMAELHSNGTLNFIVPNNFLTIKSATELREFLKINSYLKRIIDFGSNMIFKPVRTYNCILQLGKESNTSFEYYVMPQTDNISFALCHMKLSHMKTSDLDKNGWKLVDEKTYRNLRKIESQLVSLKEFVRTGIATLRDGVYFVEKDNIGFYKKINNQKYYIEEELVKPIYKVPELKHSNDIEKTKRYIIFPYIKSNSGYVLIDESSFSIQYPKTYLCLLRQREELDQRDKGKGAVQKWYAYGRTQGLNKYGRKLLFPTFSHKPRFTFIENEEALFCNGYAVFENDRYDLEILIKILNSKLMDYYISNTSYSIEGGYYCYQKKYIERFSLPWFTEEELDFIKRATPSELDNYLWKLYQLEE